MKKIVLALCFLITTFSFAVEFKKEKLIETSGVKKLSVENTNGEVEIETWDESNIELKYTITIKKSGQFQIFPKMKPKIKESDYDKIDVDILKDNKRIIIRPNIPETRDYVEIDYFIKLPVDFTDVDISVSSGDVLVKDINNNLQIKSSSGDINVEKSGKVSIGTSSGDIEFKMINGNAKLSTSSGDIEGEYIVGDAVLNVSSGDIDIAKIKGHVSVKASSGSTEIREIVGNFESNSSSGYVEVDKVTGNVNTRTSSGDISFKLIEGSGEFSANSGDIEIYELGKLESAFTTSGDITIKKVGKLSEEVKISSSSGKIRLNSTN